jgi:hypothetical protein
VSREVTEQSRAISPASLLALAVGAARVLRTQSVCWRLPDLRSVAPSAVGHYVRQGLLTGDR